LSKVLINQNMFHKIGVIINPASGVEFPVLFHINQALKHAEIEAEYHITQQANDAYSMAQAAVERGVGAIAVYGGDGTIMEVAQALSRTKIPLIILPGGSANVMAKELGIPTTLQEAVSIFSKDKHQLVDIDMGVCNKIPFMLRVTAGIWEKVVTQAKRDQKNKIGQLAYTIPIIDQLSR
jgi:diacylglycerol kinase (ATP)